MALSIGKRDVAKIAAVLDQDFDSVEEAARAVTEACFDLYESKAKFTVVGQLGYSPEGGWESREEAHACMVALGRYGTETQATNDAESFAISKATGEQFKAWILPVFHGTPASYFTRRKDAKKKIAAEAAGLPQADRIASAARELNGWVTTEEIAEQVEVAATCPECGCLLDYEHDGLATGREVVP